MDRRREGQGHRLHHGSARRRRAHPWVNARAGERADGGAGHLPPLRPPWPLFLGLL
jgi:hypothetical protein